MKKWQNLIKFIRALLLYIRIYRDGFYFSDNSHKNPDGSRWGFYRFNAPHEFAVFDIDYEFSDYRESYYHVHGNGYRKHFDRRRKR